MSRLPALAAALLLSASPALAGDAHGALTGEAPEWLAKVYAERGGALVWSRGDRPSRAFLDLLGALDQAEARGLDTSMYAADALRRLAHAGPAAREQGAAIVFARFAQDLVEGRTDPQLEYQPNFAELRDHRKGDLLRAAYARRSPMAYLAEATPDNFLVERLTDALGTYRRMAARGGWDAVARDGDVLIKAGDAHPLVPAIRERLAAEGFGGGGDGDAWSGADAAALEAFQRSRSMMEDGVVGPDTIDALNETPEDLIERLEVNIERARWLPQRLGERAAFVNAADYTLRLYEDDRLASSMPVIVGTEQTQTPVFADTMERVVVNPYWNVPASILIGEIAPKQLADPGYVAAKDFEVLRSGQIVSPASVDWAAAAGGEPDFRVRQTAGDHNALGRIKFLFPNKYAVYLHDTPADALFERDVRTFSHGCIRVAEPVRFGAWLLGMDEAEVQAMIDSEERVVLPTPATPVYVAYFTAWAEPEGDVRFARDVYDRDARVARALAGEGASGD